MALEKPVNISLDLQNTHVLITGGAGLIGSRVVSAFLSAGSKVTCLDISQECIDRLEESLVVTSYPITAKLFCKTVDITNEDAMQAAFEAARESFGAVQCCVTLAALDLSVLTHYRSIMDMPTDQWRRTLDINVTGTFITAREWARQLHFLETSRMSNVSLILIGSVSGLFGERGNADYATSKSAVQGGLLQSLKSDIPRLYPGARVNAIAPGAVDTPRFRAECAENPKQLWTDAEATTALGEPISMDSVARSIVYLASSNFSGNVHGHVLQVTSGTEGKLMFEPGEAAKVLDR